jgi:hypothetical protein
MCATSRMCSQCTWEKHPKNKIILYKSTLYYHIPYALTQRKWIFITEHKELRSKTIETIMTTTTAVTPLLLQWHHYYCSDTIITAVTPLLLQWHHYYCSDTIINAVTPLLLQWHHYYCSSNDRLSNFPTHTIKPCAAVLA